MKKLILEEGVWFYAGILNGKTFIDKSNIRMNDIVAIRAKRQNKIAINEKDLSYVEIKDSAITIGRNDECDVIINDRTVSRKHCIISKREGKWIISDLNSSNGTFILVSTLFGKKWKKIQSEKLKSGTKIKIGNNIFIFK